MWLCLLNWRNTPDAIDSSPVQHLMSRKTRSTIPTTLDQRLPKVQQDIPENITERRQHTKKQYDKGTKHLPELQVGDEVYAQLHMNRNTLPNKVVISNKLNDRSYIVSDLATKRKYRRNRHHLNKPLTENILSTTKGNNSIFSPTQEEESDNEPIYHYISFSNDEETCTTTINA